MYWSLPDVFLIFRSLDIGISVRVFSFRPLCWLHRNFLPNEHRRKWYGSVVRLDLLLLPLHRWWRINICISKTRDNFTTVQCAYTFHYKFCCLYALQSFADSNTYAQTAHIHIVETKMIKSALQPDTICLRGTHRHMEYITISYSLSINNNKH